jgi:hypothetical protein
MTMPATFAGSAGVFVRYSRADGFTHWKLPGFTPTSHAAGDFNADGFDDLVIGMPTSDPIDESAGRMVVLYGGPAGLGTDAADRQLFSQDSHPGVPDADEPGDGWAASVATGRINRDRYADLVVGAPGEAFLAGPRVGAFTVLFGGPDGLTDVGTVMYHQDSAGIPGVAEAYDEFGFAVAVGDSTGDGFADVAVSAPGRTATAR